MDARRPGSLGAGDFFAIGRERYVVAFGAQQKLEKLTGVGVVVCDQDTCRPQPVLRAMECARSAAIAVPSGKPRLSAGSRPADATTLPTFARVLPRATHRVAPPGGARPAQVRQ